MRVAYAYVTTKWCPYYAHSARRAVGLGFQLAQVLVTILDLGLTETRALRCWE